MATHIQWVNRHRQTPLRRPLTQSQLFPIQRILLYPN